MATESVGGSRSLRAAFVVATKDRPRELRRLLQSLAAQDPRPYQVVIVDAGRCPAPTAEFGGLSIARVRSDVPSAPRQRNEGVRHVDADADLVGFLDDDAVLEPGAMAAMMRFWASAPRDVAGAAFNMANRKRLSFALLKESRVVEWLGLYARQAGDVSSAGFPHRFGAFRETRFVRWIPTGACVWRRHVVETHSFDHWFDRCSYLEDLDFSFEVGKRYRLAAVADARYLHFPSPAGRAGGCELGRGEVANRLYFVRKHGLSVTRCYVGLVARMLVNLGRGLMTVDGRYSLHRAAGNAGALARSLWMRQL